MANGDGTQQQQPVTPGQTQGTTPPFMPPNPQAAADPVAQKTKAILTQLMQAAQAKKFAGQPSVQPIGEQEGTQSQLGMNTKNPHAWGTQRFLANLGATMRNAVKDEKQKQLYKAESDWSYLQSALNEKFQADQSGDQKAIAGAQAKVDAVLGDPKKLKNMAKALNQDWLNPEKTTVYGEALKRVTSNQQKTDQTNQQKQQAATGLKGMIQNLLKQKQKLQLTVDEQKRMAEEIEKKAPTTTAGVDKETAGLARDELKAEAKAAEDEKKEAARQQELEQKEKWQREETEMKEKYQKQHDQMQNTFHEHMEDLRERSAEQRQNTHDMMMMKQLGMKLDAQQEKLFKPDPTKLNKEVTDSVTSLRQQLAQSQSALKSLKTSASNHWIMGPGQDEIEGAEDTVKSYEKAIAHIEKNRDAIIKGKADLGDVVNKAYDIMGGGGAEEEVPGFKPDK